MGNANEWVNQRKRSEHFTRLMRAINKLEAYAYTGPTVWHERYETIEFLRNAVIIEDGSPVASEADPFNLVGHAAYLPNYFDASKDGVRICNVAQQSVGAMWRTKRITMLEPWAIQIYAYMKDVYGGGSDGMALVAQRDSRGINAIGRQGGWLGYGDTMDGGGVVLELDTWKNDLEGVGDPNINHMVMQYAVDGEAFSPFHNLTPTRTFSGFNTLGLPMMSTNAGTWLSYEFRHEGGGVFKSYTGPSSAIASFLHESGGTLRNSGTLTLSALGITEENPYAYIGVTGSTGDPFQDMQIHRMRLHYTYGEGGGASGQQTEWFFYYDDDTQESMGTPNAGKSVPDLGALARFIPRSIYDPVGIGLVNGQRYLNDVWKAIENLAKSGRFQNPQTGVTLNWEDGSENNLYYAAMHKRYKSFGKPDVGYHWTRSGQGIGHTPTYDVDIGEPWHCVRLLARASGVSLVGIDE